MPKGNSYQVKTQTLKFYTTRNKCNLRKKMLFQNNLKQCKPTFMSHNLCFGLGKLIDSNIIHQVYNAYETFCN